MNIKNIFNKEVKITKYKTKAASSFFFSDKIAYSNFPETNTADNATKDVNTAQTPKSSMLQILVKTGVKIIIKI